MKYQKGHIGNNFRLDLRIVLFGSRFNRRTYLKMYSFYHMNIMEKCFVRPKIVHLKT